MSSNGDIGRLVADLPRSEPQVLARAREALINGRNDLALQILEASVERHPSSNMRIALGHVLARERRYKDAMKHMVAILRDEPRNSEALLLLTDSLLECGEYERAGKMLGRASACDADPEECKRLTDKLNNLTGETASNVVSGGLSPHDRETRPEQPAPSSDVDVDRNIRIDQPARKRRHTMQGGRPAPEWDVGDPRGDAPDSAPPVPGPMSTPATLRSGTFSTLSGWSEDDATIESGLHPGPDMGAPSQPSRPPQPPQQVEPTDQELNSTLNDVFDDFEVQATVAFVADDEASPGESEFANPSDQTAAITFEDDQVRKASLGNGPSHSAGEATHGETDFEGASVSDTDVAPPSIEYDEIFSGEVARHGYDDDQPTRERDSLADGWPEQQSQAGQSPAPSPVQSPVQSPEPALHFEAPAPAFASADSAPNMQPNPFGAPTFQDPMAPQPHHPAPEGQEGRAPEGPKRREPTGLTPAASVSRDKANAGDERGFVARRWPLLLILVVLLIAATAAGMAFGSAYMQSEEIREMLTQADEAASSDTYQGYLTADEKLDAAAAHSSFLGPAVDEVVQSALPAIPGSEAGQLQRTALARRAYIASLLEFRFEEAGARDAAKALEGAANVGPDHSDTVAAQAYQLLAEGRPHQALVLLDGAQKEIVGELGPLQARVEAHLSLRQHAAAALAVKNFRTLEKPTIYQQLLIARVDLALEDPSAAEQLAGLHATAKDHIDARLEQSYTLHEGDEAREEAQRSLNTIEAGLKPSASKFQLARTAMARGALAESGGDRAEAEKHYRSGIRKFPVRPELYFPLIELEFREAKYNEVRELLEKAAAEGATHPLLDVARARLLVLESKPGELDELFADKEWEDARRDFYLGLAALDRGDLPGAAKNFTTGAERSGEFVAPTAFVQVARALQTPAEAEKAAYQVDRLISKHPRDAFVHWASALVRLALADQMKDRDAFAEALDKAEEDLEKAVKLAPGWPLFHYTLCDVHLRGLEGKDAAKACKMGQKMAPNYVPGLLTYAQLRLQQGEFEDAATILAGLKERRSDEDRIALLAARASIELGQLEDAEKTINEMLGKEISNGFEMKLLEGRLAFARRDYAKASGYLASAHELRPQDGEAGTFYAVTLARLGKLEEAEEVIQDLLTDRVWAAAAWTTFGEVRRRQERYRDAEENFRIGLRKIGESALPKARASELWLQYALTARDQRGWDHSSVSRRLDLALTKGDPDDSDVHFARGLYALKKRRPDEAAAAESFQKVVDVSPWRCDAIKALDALYKKLEKDDQREAIQKLSEERCKAKE